MITRIAVVGSCSGQGKTTLARTLAGIVGGPLVELDSLRHGPGWTITPDDAIRGALAPIVATERWAVDAIAEKSVGRLILDRAQLIVWLDLPARVWLPRLLRRSGRRWLLREELWNGNRETLRGIFLDRDGVFPWAIRKYFFHRDALAAQLTGYVLEGKPVAHLGSVRQVERFVEAFAASAGAER